MNIIRILWLRFIVEEKRIPYIEINFYSEVSAYHDH